MSAPMVQYNAPNTKQQAENDFYQISRTKKMNGNRQTKDTVNTQQAGN